MKVHAGEEEQGRLPIISADSAPCPVCGPDIAWTLTLLNRAYLQPVPVGQLLSVRHSQRLSEPHQLELLAR